MVRLIKRYKDREYKTEAKQVGTLYHVCTLDAFVNRIIEDKELGTKDNLHSSGKYWNKLLNTKKAVSFTRDPLFVVPTWTVQGAKILFQFVINGEKLSEHYKITPYNGNGVNPKYREKEEVVKGQIKNFKSYIKEVRFDIKTLFFDNTDEIIKDLKKVQEYLGSIPCKRKHLPFLKEDWSIDYKKTSKEDDLYKVKTLDELITLLESLENIDIKDYIDSKELFGKYFIDLSEDQRITLLKIHPEWINSRDKFGMTPLFWACVDNNIDMVKLLLKHGADINSEAKDGTTPLSWAYSKNNTELVKLLIEHSADVNSKDKYGNSLLYQACDNKDIEIVKLLLEHDADVNIKNKNGETPLSRACYYNLTELVKLLLEHGADVNVKNKYGLTPLYRACSNKYTKVVKLLIEYGADVNTKDEYGRTPLYWTCSNGNTEIVKLLLEHGADVSINLITEDGFTPLYWACYYNHTEIVKLLLEHGAGKDLDADSLPDYITRNKEIEELVLSYLNKNKGRNESIRLRRLYRL